MEERDERDAIRRSGKRRDERREAIRRESKGDQEGRKEEHGEWWEGVPVDKGAE